jgi:PAS domain S-box-containing protein
MMDRSAVNRAEQMEDVLHDKITLLHQHLTSLEEVLDQYRQMRQSLLESEARFRLLIEHVKDYAIFMLDPEGNITTWNIGAAQIKGYRAEEIIGHHFSTFYTAADRERGKPTRGLEIARREGRFLDEGWRVRKDGSQFWASVVLTAIHDQAGRLLGFGKVTRDLTERKRMEDALSRQYEAQEAIRMRDAFLSVAAHELKTPITNLQGFAQVTLRYIEKAEVFDCARIVRALQMIDAQADKLGQLVKQLLDIAQMQARQSKLVVSRINVTELVQQVVSLIEVQTSQHTVVFQAPPNLMIEADALRLEQVLVNVLDNAVKYSPQGGQIVVAIDELDSSRIQISISDQGIGIPEDERERIFEPFYRVSSEKVSSVTSGVGLGLFVSQQIIAMHHGQIGVEAVPGGGSRFMITLPIHHHTAMEQAGESGS